MTDGYSGSDIRLVAKEAAMRPVRKVFDILESYDAGGKVTNWIDVLLSQN